MPQWFRRFSAGRLERHYAVNLYRQFLGCQVIGKQMLAQGKGSIINMASFYGWSAPTIPFTLAPGLISQHIAA